MKAGEIRKAIKRNVLRCDGDEYSKNLIHFVINKKRFNQPITNYYHKCRVIERRYDKRIATLKKKIKALSIEYLEKINSVKADKPRCRSN